LNKAKNRKYEQLWVSASEPAYMAYRREFLDVSTTMAARGGHQAKLFDAMIHWFQVLKNIATVAPSFS